MASRKSWVSTNELLKPGRLTNLLPRLISENDGTRVLGRVGKGVSAPVPVDSGAPRTPLDQPGNAQLPGVAEPAAPKHVAQFTPMPRRSEVAHDEPSLASRTRPDLVSPDQRHQAFLNAYHDKKAMNTSLRQHNKGSLNVVFHGNMTSGHQYIAKPHEGIGHRDLDTIDPDTLASLKGEAPDFGRRHDATYELMSAMGAHHMVVPGATTNMHQRHQFKGPDPDADDSPSKRLTMAASHAGGLAHVQEFIPGAVNVNHATPEQLDKVDAEHRLHGIVSHLLFGAQDGHGGNVIIHPSGHPVMIDHDLTLGSPQAAATKQQYGKDAFMSVFSPGSPLDYQAKLPKDSAGQMIPVGTNFPPRMRETLERAAEGYFTHGPNALDLSPADAHALQMNARQLLLHGLEGTLERKHDMGQELNGRLAQKQALNAQVDADAAAQPAPAKKPRRRKR